MRKKGIALVTAGVLAAGMCACGEEPPKTEGTALESAENQTDTAEGEGTLDFSGVTLNLAHSTTGDVAEAFTAQFEAFEERTGCKIEVERLSTDGEESESTMRVRAATGNLPDIWQNSIGAKLKNISPEENCYDLSGQDWISNISEDYRTIVSDADTGALYAVPLTTSNVAGVFYNKDLYEELGLEVPETWEEFLKNCETVKTETGKTPCAAPYSNTAGVQILFLAQYYYVQEENPDFARQYTEKELELHDSPAYLRGLTKMYDLWEKGYQCDDPLSLSFEDAAVQIAEGEAAMMICRTDVMATVEELAKEKMDSVGFFPLPDENADTIGVATWMPPGWVMNKNIASEKEACALALMEFLTTKEAVDAFCTKTTPTGAFMLNGVALPDTVSNAVKEAQAWVEKSSCPVMEYSCDIKGSNMATILQMVGTGEYTPEEAIGEIEIDNAIDAQQKGLSGW